MTISRQALFGKLGTTLFRSIESATSYCKLRGNPYVELEHWLHQLLRMPDGDLQRIVRHCGLNRDQLDEDLTHALAALPAGASSISDFSHFIEEAIERAWVIATLEFNDRRVRGAWLLAALLKTPELRRVLLSLSNVFGKVPVHDLDAMLPAWIEGSPENDDAPYDGGDYAAAVPGEASAALTSAGQGGSPLDQYCVDLTARARAGEIDPVVGRDVEIRTMIDILLRRRQNNPLLTGEAGVGKTAVVEGLARAIASGAVPPKLVDVRLLSVDVGALLAGASMKGEFEARLKGLLDAAGKSTAPVVLFVDEVHTLIGAGGQAGTGDAANLLKPALARGKIRTIGATTWAEYKRHIEKDPALTRRFHVLQVMEPEEAAAITMVRSLAGEFSAHHGVVILDEAIGAAVKLSHRYIPARQLPDKAISLLDTACARVALSQHAEPRELQDVRQRLLAAQTEHELLFKEACLGMDTAQGLQEVQARIQMLREQEGVVVARWEAQNTQLRALLETRAGVDVQAGPDMALTHELRKQGSNLARLQGEAPLVFPEVNAAIVAAIVSDWTGIPVGGVLQDEVASVQSLPRTLADRVVGQTEALERICRRVRSARAGLTDAGKPLGVFLLAGPSGVGKTETALALAAALYGGEQNLITINMSEYQEAHTVSGLKGAPPGYVGYGEGGVLTEAVRRRPYSVVLLDEIEKAHSDVHEMFFQVFDKGYMEDGDGRHIDFRNTTIFLTSNAGSDLIANLHADEELEPGMEALCEALEPELLKTFPAAFMGRVTLVPYRPLAQASLARIVALHLDRVVKRIADTHGTALSYSPALVTYVVSRCLVEHTGARVLIGFIEEHVLPRLAALVLEALAAKRRLLEVVIEVGAETDKPARALDFRVKTGQE